ncbi:MAG: hypothetical protein U1D69_14925 [Polynucleobacter sp.]|nr:hypothetical protein [Polynucleobacter sp.]
MTALESVQTLEQLELLASQDRTVGILLRIIKVSCPTTFSNAVIEAISEWIEGATRQAHLYRGLKEDQITLFLITHLNASGFDATHDTSNGGHCDVVVKHSKGYIWLAEAKIHNGPEYIKGGYLQLTSRYAHGTQSSPIGGLLIYIFKSKAMNLLDEWREAVDREFSSEGHTTHDCPSGNKLVFISDLTCERSGLPYQVNHFAVPLFFNPRA